MPPRVAVPAFVVLLATGCGGARHATRPAPKPQAPQCVRGSDLAIGTTRIAWAAVVKSSVVAYAVPRGRVIARFGATNANGVSTVFGVLGERVDASCRARWFHVQLPLRPNGLTGWVRANRVETASVRTRIVVDVSQRRLRLYRNGRFLLASAVAVGKPSTPTPTGRFYVNQRLVPTDTSGPFGPGAVGISAFSNVLTGWTEGGPVAIHGTNEPWSIGHDVSNGCIRLPNAVLRRVFALALAGTPVVIRR